MTTTTPPGAPPGPPGGSWPPDPPGRRAARSGGAETAEQQLGDVEALGLPPHQLLGHVRRAKTAANTAEIALLQAACAWADAHPADPTHGIPEAVDWEQVARTQDHPPMVGPLGADGRPGPGGREGWLRLAGQGATTMAEFAIAPFACAAGTSERTTRTLIATPSNSATDSPASGPGPPPATSPPGAPAVSPPEPCPGPPTSPPPSTRPSKPTRRPPPPPRSPAHSTPP